MYFWKLLLLAQNLKSLPKNNVFWVWAELTKWRSPILVSAPIWILFKFVILNILLWFECQMYFWCLLYSNYRRTRDLSLHHDVCHYNVHPWWNFQIFWNNFLFDMIFLHFFFKNSHKNQFSSKKSKIFVTWRRHVASSLKNNYKKFHSFLVQKWQQTEWWALRIKPVVIGPSFKG